MANDLVAATTPEMKLSWAFRMYGHEKENNCYIQDFFASRYDLDNSGAIDKDEMVNVMKSIYSMVDGNVSEANRGSTMDKVKTR